MDLFTNFIQAVNNASNNSFNNSKEATLRQQLSQCTYTDDTKFIIQKAIKQVFHVYPNFNTEILAFKQNNIQKRYIELKSILQIEVRGKPCKVDYNMMIPNEFPKKPPYVRIINRNPDFKVDDFYLSLKSPNDPKSYILNEKLNQARTWDPSKSIVNIIIESNELFRARFPFSKPTTNQSVFPNQGTWGNNSPWQQLNQPQNYNNMNQGYNNFGNVGSNQPMGYNNVGMGGGYNNYGNNMNNNMNMNMNNPIKPPIPFNPHNLTQTIASGQIFVGKTKKILQKLKDEHNKALQTVQTLDILNYSIQSQENYLRRENNQMLNFLQTNKHNDDNQSLVKLVKPQDQLSQQILDLVSSIKARQDCTIELQKKFNDEQITLQEFMKYVRKLQEAKFQEKVLLAKCINVAQKY